MPTAIMNRRLSVAVVWFFLLLLSLYLYIFEPGKTGFFLLCPFRMLTGFQCPGCGSTRALHQLMHGHLLNAFTLNPLFVISLPFLLLVLVRHTAYVMRGEVPPGNVLPPSVIYAIFFIALSFWIIRNTPIYPFVS
jgi:hypothetical protein